ncbi:MAG: hypothetical protein WC924_01715 [Candidatus Gracilibacteria bacterium]
MPTSLEDTIGPTVDPVLDPSPRSIPPEEAAAALLRALLDQGRQVVAICGVNQGLIDVHVGPEGTCLGDKTSGLGFGYLVHTPEGAVRGPTELFVVREEDADDMGVAGRFAKGFAKSVAAVQKSRD